MKLHLLLSLPLLVVMSAQAVTLTANFDSLPTTQSVAAPYTEGGIQFTSPTEFQVATGYFGAVLFGWGGYTYAGNALHVHNSGWVGISAPGNLIDSVSFKYGLDWNGYSIELGLMDTTFGWEALRGGAIVASGSQTWVWPNRTHGNIQLTVDPAADFDTLHIRSTAVEYRGIVTGSLQSDRGEVIGYGDTNHIAFDDVRVTTVPDTGSPVLLLLASLCPLVLMRRFIRWRSTHSCDGAASHR